MSEDLLKAIVLLFAIVSKNKASDDERGAIMEFLSMHLDQESIGRYLRSYDDYKREPVSKDNLRYDDHQPFSVQVSAQAEVEQLAERFNLSLGIQQKMVLLITIINLIYTEGEITEQEENFIFFIGRALKIQETEVKAMLRFVTGSDADELSSENILIIDEGLQARATSGPRLTVKNLTGLIAILRMAGTEIYFIKYLGISTIYLNSVAMRSRKIEIFPTGSTIRSNRIEPVYYSEVVGQFLQTNEQQVTFRAEGISFYFKNGRAGLQNINIAEQGGTLAGLMGASGSGKSTLLNVLNGTEKPGGGKVSINGIDIYEQPEEVAGVIGYIPQDDLLIEELTVYENLYYAAKLCFGHYSEKQLSALAEGVLANLGLLEIQHLKVGSVLDKTISGGQRKRVNIGLELLREPSLLFVDEPTSGLSSRDSENIMDLLKELSLRGKMVFVVIHQPSSEIFKMFDSLIILDTGGLQIYYGNPVEAVPYFRKIVDAAGKSSAECPACGNVNPEQIFDIIETRVVNEYGRATDVRKISPEQWNRHFSEKAKFPRVTPPEDLPPASQKIPGRLKQLQVFFTRDVLTKLSNKQYMAINLLEAPLLAAFIAYLVKFYAVHNVKTPEYTFYQNENIPVFYFMSVVVVLFFGLTMSAEEIFRDRRILKRERFLHLSKGSYLNSKILIMFMFSAFQTLTFLIIGNMILEIPLSEFRYWLILFSCSCFANMLGLNISASFNSAVTIYILIPILLIPQLLLSGVVVNFEKFNPRLGGSGGVPFIGELMASRWAFEAFMVTQFKDNPLENLTYEAEKEIANIQYKQIYYFPALESKLEYCINHPEQWNRDGSMQLKSALFTLGNELGRELKSAGRNDFRVTNQLLNGKFDSAVFNATAEMISQLKDGYSKKMRQAVDKKDSIVNRLAETPEKLIRYRALRNRYLNEAVAEAVKNTNTTNRIVEVNGQLLQRIYPIYFDDHRPANLFDFRGNFYIPAKHFLGYKIDTLYFNIAMIWLMTIILYITLYYDVLKRIINFNR